VRPVIYRASLTELWVPYGDPRSPYYRRSAFDMVDSGIAFLAAPQIPNEDVIGAYAFFDLVLNDRLGVPYVSKNAISVREEDAGILWKHVDYRTGKGVVTRSHRLVFSIVYSGVYDYNFQWIFYQDGSIQYEIQLTGILTVALRAPTASPHLFGSTVAPQINGLYHQHLFTVRMDVDIDGVNNSVHLEEAMSLPDSTGSPNNPYGQGFTVNKTELKTAAQGRTNISPLTGRIWVVTNPNVGVGKSGQEKGWKLVPASGVPLLMKEDSPLRKKAGYASYNMWITPYSDDQIYPAGFHLNNSGLSEWVGNKPGDSIVNTDIVLYYTFTVTHFPRVEDWPVMPVE
jgi:primary-amine oxidase